jgi:putative ABC transport system permease protein
MTTTPQRIPFRSHLRAGDVVALGLHGLRAHPLRATLSALGIAIGIAAMIAVIGISTSSQALVNQKLSALGTNLLTASAGKDLFNNGTKLPIDSAERIRRIDGVHNASWTALIDKRAIYRNSSIDTGSTGGLSVITADLDLLETTSTTVASGHWINQATSRFPAVVLGSKAAERLGIVTIGTQVWLSGTQFTVVGILDPSALAPELDQTAIVGADIAAELFGFDGAPTTIYELSVEGSVETVRALLPQTIRPDAPNEVKVSRPSDALAAKNTVDQAFTGLLVGVGSIALLVGGIGVANTMVISVLERRREIGMRRSLGATKRHIRTQFLVEAMLLAAYGGLAGTVLGWLITAIVANSNGWLLSIPVVVLVAGVSVTVVVGAIAGVLPAVRAARTSPTAALAS